MVALSSMFLNPAGLAAALILIPFLILYLIRPKPRHETIPSLLFVMKDTGRTNINSFFRTFLRDLVFLFQLLALCAIALAVARPYIEVPREYLVDQNVLLVDVSASTHAGSDARFHEIIDKAKANLGKENTIILVKGAPEVIAERVSSTEAEKRLDGLKPTDTETALTDALKLAGSYAGDGTRIVVISDFIPTSGDPDYDTAATALETTGAIVEYVPVGGQDTNNVGITDLLVGPVTSSVWIKNFNARPAQVTLRISEAEQQVLLGRGETKQVNFNTPAGVAEIRIKEDDSLLADNVAWTSAPQKNTIRMLIITNDRAAVEKSNFALALSVISKNFPMNFDISYAAPPKMPALDHDVYVLYNVKPEFLLPGDIKRLQEKVSQGAALVVFAQPDVFSLDWRGLLPVVPAQSGDGGRATIVAEGVTPLTKDLDFGQAAAYMRVAKAEDATVVARTETDPIIALRREGRGNVLYYGIDDAKASFSKEPSYPVFWRRAFDLLTDRPSLNNLNVRTGTMIALQRPAQIKTPDGTVNTNLLPIERAGLYTLPDRTVAANMLSPTKSSLAPPANVSKQRAAGDAKSAEKVPDELTGHMLWAAIGLLLLELLYVKWRGDF